jgi:hypothetical protein
VFTMDHTACVCAQMIINLATAPAGREIIETSASALGRHEGNMSAIGAAPESIEKRLRDPDDVFIHAEERRKELARQGRKSRRKRLPS